MSNKADVRNNTIIRFNLIGIIMNTILSIFKIIIGNLYNAHAVALDGVNGFSDAMSYLLSIVSSLLNKKGASKNLPLGYGRIEYLFSMATTILVSYVGFRSIIESVDSIIHPHEAPEYNIIIVIVALVSFFAKSLFGLLLRKNGEKLNSIAMIMSGTDSICDSLVSIAILAAIAVLKLTGVDIEHYVCIIISLLIILTGLKMLGECMNKILGGRVDPEFKKQITNMIIQEPEVQNVSNLIIHNYGENVYVGSVDIEVDQDMRAIRITELSRRLISKAEELGLKLTSVGIIATNITDKRADEIYDRLVDKVIHSEGISRINSFSVDFKKKQMSFYIVVDYQIKDKEATKEKFLEEVKQMYPDMDIEILTAIDM